MYSVSVITWEASCRDIEDLLMKSLFPWYGTYIAGFSELKGTFEISVIRSVAVGEPGPAGVHQAPVSSRSIPGAAAVVLGGFDTDSHEEDPEEDSEGLSSCDFLHPGL